MAQANQFAYAAPGINAGVLDDVAEFRQAVQCEFIVPILNCLDEVLDILDNFVADVVNLLGQLAVT